MAALAAMWYLNQIPAQATETGTITTLSEKVYESMDEGSSVVANVIMDIPFSLLSAEYDGGGNVWYRIRTDMGIEGYIPAQNVRTNGSDSEGSNAEEAEGQLEEPPEEGVRPEDRQETSLLEQEVDREKFDQDNRAVGEDRVHDSSVGVPGETDRQVRTIESVNMRRDPTTDSDIVGRIPPRVTLECIGMLKNEIGENWYEISYEGVRGYVRESTVDVINQIPPQEDRANGQNSENSQSVDETDIPGGELLSGPANTANGGENFQTQNSAGTAEPLDTQDFVEGEKVGFIGREDPDGTVTEDAQPGYTAKKWRLYIDWVAVGAFLGCFLCLMALYHLVRQIRKLYRGKVKKERTKECLPNKRKRHT